jgi:hypothetical protein
MSSLINCTIKGNHCPGSRGAGVQQCVVRNSLIISNFLTTFGFNYQLANDGNPVSDILYSCIKPQAVGMGNIDVDPQFIEDGFHVAAGSPCRGAGNPLYSTGFDLDQEAFTIPPSMGCDEIIDSNLIGPLSVRLVPSPGNLVNRNQLFYGLATGRVSAESWSFGDGSTATNTFFVNHIWTNTGDFDLTFTAYNKDNPSGVSTNLVVTIVPLASPVITPLGVQSNRFWISFPSQYGPNYTLQYATNLSQTNWTGMAAFYSSTGGVFTVGDPNITNGGTRFYRIQTQ